MAKQHFTINGVTKSYMDGGLMVSANTLARLATGADLPDGKVLVCEHDGARYTGRAAVNLSLHGGDRKFVIGESR